MLKKIANAVIECEMDEITEYVEAAKAAGFSAKEILDEGLVKGMDVIGKLFSDGELFVPEVLMAANTMQEGLEVIKEDLASQGGENSKGTLVIGTVNGDLHDIGKKLVAMMIEGAGFKVIDLGVDVKAEDFIKAAKENDADFIGMSAMLTTTMTEMKKIVEMAKAEGLRAQALVGGAPLTSDYAESFGAKYSHDAAGAVELVKSLV